VVEIDVTVLKLTFEKFFLFLPIFLLTCLVVYFSQHAFVKKEWYNVHVPSIFDVRVPTLTPCNKTAGQSK